MTETPGSADESPARDTSPGAPARRLRVRMSTLMVFVLTAAVASALFVELRRLLKPMGSSARVDIDVPTVLILGLALNAAALGALRRLAPVQVLVQISVCCLLFLTGVWACEWHLWR